MRFNLLRLLPALMLVIPIIGCSTTHPIRYDALADPEAHLPPAEQVSIALALVRIDEAGRAGEPITRREAMSLEERTAQRDLMNAMADVGFHVVEPDLASHVAFWADVIERGEYDSYRRVPVHETTHGTIHTRRGWRSFHGTTTTSVVVPVRRQFVNRTFTVEVHEVPEGVDPDDLVPEGETVVWKTRISGRLADLEENTAAHLRKALEMWGRTDRKVNR